MLVTGQLIDHCEHFFGCRGELYQFEAADVLIAVYPASRRRGWWTYVTLELHKTGASECMLYSYQFQKGMLAHLATIASAVIRQWEQEQKRVQAGELFKLEEAIAEGSVLNHAVLTPAYFEEVGFGYFTNGADVIRFMMLHAIAESEAAYVERFGLDALQECFAHSGVDSLHVMRTPAI